MKEHCEQRIPGERTGDKPAATMSGHNEAAVGARLVDTVDNASEGEPEHNPA